MAPTFGTRMADNLNPVGGIGPAPVDPQVQFLLSLLNRMIGEAHSRCEHVENIFTATGYPTPLQSGKAEALEEPKPIFDALAQAQGSLHALIERLDNLANTARRIGRLD